jgi:hypothetical protein
MTRWQHNIVRTFLILLFFFLNCSQPWEPRPLYPQNLELHGWDAQISLVGLYEIMANRATSSSWKLPGSMYSMY